MNPQQSLILIEMGSDSRIPRESVGYISDLSSASCSPAVAADRLDLLNRYVPDLVSQFVAAGIDD